MTQVAVVLLPYSKNTPDLRDPEARLNEAVSLTKAIELNVVHSESIAVREIKAGTYLGQGTIERLADIIEEKKVDVVIMACTLSPLQQRNLEKHGIQKLLIKQP